MAGGKKASAVTSKNTQSVKANDVKSSKTQDSLKPKPTLKSALASDSSDDDEPAATMELKVNQKFAKDYIDRKRKEELTQLERQRAYLENDDDDESDSETEDEDAEELTNELDNDIKKTLRLIRNRDPIIYDQSVAFFLPKEGDDDESDGSESDSEMKLKKQKGKKKDAPLYYKDLVRQQVIAGDVDGSDDEEDNAKPRIVTYGEEQAQLKQDFLKSLQSEESNETRGENDDQENEEESDLEGGLFSVRAKSDAEQQQDDAEYEQFKSKYGSKMKKNEIDPEAFLENYLAGGWKEKKTEIPRYDEIVAEDEEDAEELEKMEDFEHAYNFRYEEEGSGLIQTYARTIDDSMRRKDDSRKRKREERKERKALERLKKEEELRRLKNLKQAELEKKLQKIAKLVGKTSEEDRLQAVLSKDLEGDFDPEEYDRRMQQIFDDQYYNEDDDEMDKPTWDDEEDKELFAGLPVDEEDEEEEAEPEKMEVVDEEEDVEEEEEMEEEKEVADGEEAEEAEEAEDADTNEETAKKMTAAELQRAKQKYLDELYSLDYEDLIGDLKCRFKYREVRKNDFGLTAEEIMAADDKELKGLVSLKRLAPYMEEEYTINRRKVKNFKRSLEEKQAEEALKKKKKKTAEENEDAEENAESAAAVEEAPTKKRKRTKKNKQQSATESASSSVVAAEADEKYEKDDVSAVEAEETHEKDEKDEGEEEAKKTKESTQPQKKKSRRGGKKKKEVNPFAATGLSSSRLESYKLIKGSKK